MDFIFNSLDDWGPHRGGEGFFDNGDTKINEMGPCGDFFYLQKLGDVTEDWGWTVPPIDLAFIQIHSTSRGLKEEFKRDEEVPGYLGGGDSQKDSVICK